MNFSGVVESSLFSSNHSKRQKLSCLSRTFKSPNEFLTSLCFHAFSVGEKCRPSEQTPRNCTPTSTGAQMPQTSQSATPPPHGRRCGPGSSRCHSSAGLDRRKGAGIRPSCRNYLPSVVGGGWWKGFSIGESVDIQVPAEVFRP